MVKILLIRLTRCWSYESGKVIIDGKKRSGHQITLTDDEHRKHVDDLIRITQKRIANHIGISKDCVAFIIEQLEYRKICSLKFEKNQHFSKPTFASSAYFYPEYK